MKNLNIKSKTLFVISLLLAMVSFGFISCEQVNTGNENNALSEEELKELELAEKKAEYAKIKGKTYIVTEEESSPFNEGETFWFTDTELILKSEDVEYGYSRHWDIDLEEDFYFDTEYNLWVLKFNGTWHAIIHNEDYSTIFLCNDFRGKGERSQGVHGELIDTSPETDPEENTSSELEGTYSFNTASGSQVDGSITLKSDLTWSYSGPKSTLTPSTYSVNGNKLTLNWSANTYGNTYERTDTLTVEISGSEATLTSTDSTLSAFFSDFFGVATTTTLTLAFSAE